MPKLNGSFKLQTASLKFKLFKVTGTYVPLKAAYIAAMYTNIGYK